MPIERTVTVLLAILAVSAPLMAQDESEGYQYQDATVIETTLKEVLARPEFQRLRAKPKPEPEASSETPGWLGRLLDKLSEWLSRGNARESKTRSGAGAATLIYVLAAAGLFAVLAFLARSIFLSVQDRDIGGQSTGPSIARSGAAPGETAPEEFSARADELASRKQYKAAIRELLLGAMSATERRGLIRHRRGLTNRDYLSATGGAMRESMRTIVSAFELVYFGRRDASEESFRECALSFERAFGVVAGREAS